MSQTGTNKIVVGVDFSDTGEQALCEAMRLARQLPGSELHVTSVIETDGNLHDKNQLEYVSNELRSRADELHKHIVRICAPEPGASKFTQHVVLHVRIGAPAEALIQVAVDVEADMIVVGTHRRHGIDKLRVGSIAETLVRSAPLPVLVAYPRDFSKFAKTARLDPAHPGEQLYDQGLTVRAHVEFVPRTTHISGLL
jgi:nucleotide-binding universal stress UspA family protein